MPNIKVTNVRLTSEQHARFARAARIRGLTQAGYIMALMDLQRFCLRELDPAVKGRGENELTTWISEALTELGLGPISLEE